MNIPINIETLLSGKVVESERIGEFLKELHLSEGKGTGIPTIKRVLEANGSPPAKYDTNGDNKQFFITEFTIHNEFRKHDRAQDSSQDDSQDRNQDKVLSDKEIETLNKIRDQVGDQVGDQVVERIIQALGFCFEPKTKREILESLNLTNKSTNFKANVLPAIEVGLLAKTIPDKPTSKNQKYITTEKGKKILGLL